MPLGEKFDGVKSSLPSTSLDTGIFANVFGKIFTMITSVFSTGIRAIMPTFTKLIGEIFRGSKFK